MNSKFSSKSLIDQIYEKMVENIRSSDYCDDQFSSALEKTISDGELINKEKIIVLMSLPPGDLE